MKILKLGHVSESLERLGKIQLSGPQPQHFWLSICIPNKLLDNTDTDVQKPHFQTLQVN